MFPFHNLTEQEECELLFECRFLVPHSDFHISIVVWVWESSCMLGEWLIFPPRCRFLWIPGATDWCERTVSTELAPGSIIWLEIWFKVFCMGLNWKKQFSYSDNSCSKTFNVYKWYATRTGKRHNLRDFLQLRWKDIFIWRNYTTPGWKDDDIRGRQLAQDAGPDSYDHL